MQLTVYNITGQKIARLVEEEQVAGEHSVEFDGSDLAEGMYFYRLDVGDFQETGKMILRE